MSEQLAIERIIAPETYARSLSGIRKLGEVAIAGYVPEKLAEVALERTWNDFKTSIDENLTTDHEFGEELIFNPVKSWNILGGRVCSEYGTPMVGLVRDGLRASEQATIDNPEMAVQVDRDKGDVMVAERVDELKIGEFLGVVSLDPKSAIKENQSFWEDTMGYRDGMAVFQGYFRASEDELITTTVAIKRSDKKSLALLLQDFGSMVDENTDDNHWTRHPVELSGLSREQAISFGEKIRLRHRELIKDNIPEYSTTDFIEAHDETLLNYFDAYMRPLSEATYEEKNNLAMQEFAQSIQENIGAVDPEVKSRLLKIANSSHFNDDDARLMESMIRYSVVEELRKKLPRFKSGLVDRNCKESISYTSVTLPKTYYNPLVYEIQRNQMNNVLALNIRSGLTAGRSYGGCSSSNMNQNVTGEVNNSFTRGIQDVFGGQTESSKEEKGDKDDLGPRKFYCTKGHENYRKIKNKPEKECRTCGEDVSCGMD